MVNVANFMLCIFYHNEITEKKKKAYCKVHKGFTHHKVNSRQTTPSLGIVLWIFKALPHRLFQDIKCVVVPIFLLLFFPLLLHLIIPLCFITWFLLSNLLYIYLPHSQNIFLISLVYKKNMNFTQREL